MNGRGREFWRVRLGKRFTGGQILKRDFATRALAREWIFGAAKEERAAPVGVVTLKATSGSSAFDLTASEIAEASSAIKLCRAAGVSLIDAVRFYTRHNRPGGGSKPIIEVIDALCRAKEGAGRSPDYTRRLRWCLGKFAAGTDENRPIHEFDHTAIENWLDRQTFTLKTRGNYLRDLGILFNFAASREWCAENPCSKIRKPRLPDSDITVMKPEDCARFLALSPSEFIPGICIKLFAGLRTSELLSLDWKDIGASEIVIRGANAKTRKRRVVAIPDNLQEWLRDHRRTEGKVAEFPQNTWHRGMESIASDSGMVLPSNVFRHTFGSYHFAQHKNENLTAAEMGNSPTVIFQHYRALVSSQAAALFWEIRPAQESKILEFAA